ncbi:LytS/YhcK type 5TM receptor domain-containing protein [Methanobrevibacter sp.]|uniref:LytS/YhcK type 5TM receptor domain-containing protein n=1 Tax=Methanobrevibacter sp. TaxID=66852 RepID=UPI00386C651C
MVNVSFTVLNNLLTMGAAIIIFGFISTRLPQFRNLRDSSIYEIGYLIIIGIFSIVISIFNQSTHSAEFLMPFLNMFKVLSVVLIFMLIATKTKSFNNILHREFTKKDLFIAFVIFSILGCLASRYTIPVNSSFANVRNLIILIAGLFGGPYVGIPAGIVSGGFRFFAGGTTALPCSLATVIAGFLGSLINILNDGKFPKGRSAVILMFLYVGFEMALIIWLTPPNISIVYINDIYPLMLFGGVMGMILCVMIFREVKSDNEFSYEKLEIKELENTLESYQDELEKLQEDVELLKKKNDIE